MSRLSLSTASPARFGARIGASAGAWVPRLLSLAVWSAVAGSAVYWALSLSASPQPVPSHARVTDPDAGLRGDLSRLFGAPVGPGAAAQVPPAAAASRFKVVGVVGSVRGGPGVALLAVDGKAAKAYRVGASVDGDWVLQSVTQKAVRLAPSRGGAALELELPALPAAATGQLPGADTSGAAPAPLAVPLPGGGLPGRGLNAPPVPGMPAAAPLPPAQGVPAAPPVNPPQIRPDGTVVPPEPVAGTAPGG